MNVRDKEYFKQRAEKGMREDLPVIKAPVPHPRLRRS